MNESGQNNQNRSKEQKLTKSKLIKKLCHSKYSKEEKERIFLSDNGRKCQTCHKLKINKKLSPYNFSDVINNIYVYMIFMIEANNKIIIII